MNVRPTVHTRQHEPLRVRSSAMFDHSAPELKAVDRADATRLLLAEMQRQTAEDVRREVPRLFTQLVQTLRQADAASLARLLREQTQQTTRKYLMDALPMLGTAAALVVMRDMVMLGQVASEETDRWMTSLAFVHEPRLDMVEAVAPLLADAGVRTQTLLGVSAMLHRFCRADVDCAQRPAVRQAVSSIEQLLGGDCASESREGRTRVLAALKALGNVGLLIRGEGVLRACFASKDDVETRLEAIRAYRRMPCAVVSNSGLVHTFANHLENSEVRIAAYLAVTQCATHEVVDKLNGNSIEGNCQPGSVDEDDGMYSIATSLSSHALTGTLNGMFRHDGTSLVLQTATEYSVLDGPTRTISLNTKLDKEALGEQALYKLTVETKRGRRFGEIAFQAAHMDVDFKLATELDVSGTSEFSAGTRAN
ncbi:apolipophorins-like [Pollicipes pollicipes]|uniref:apolipophorins-like n=1 Tax=Pollicipes pollicipes TaxID=41117 RepID=UPI001885171D|nr:apolipophorins-like [Pollicipes pollicipes]